MNSSCRQSKVFIWLVISLTFQWRIALQEPNAQCNQGVGLAVESYEPLEDSAFSSNIGKEPSKGRLHHPDGSWCIDTTTINPEIKASLNVDLGGLRFVSAVQTQGPPESQVGIEYNHMVRFTVEGSDDESKWFRMNYSIEPVSKDNDEEVNVIQTDTFDSIVLVKYVRMTIESIMSSHDDVCLRFEILGCSPDVEPRLTIDLQSNLDGSLLLTWQQPEVDIDPKNKKTALLNPNQYYLKYSFVDPESGSVVLTDQIRTEYQQAAITGAFIGATVVIVMTCAFEGLIVNCGTHSFNTYPPCPKGWYHGGLQCHFLHIDAQDWSAAKSTCESTSFSATTAATSHFDSSTTVWYGTDKCLQANSDKIEEMKCCFRAKLTNDKLRSLEIEEIKSCNPSDSFPVSCAKDLKVTSSVPNDIRFQAVSDSSVELTWSNEPFGWNTLTKYVTVSSENQELPSHTIRSEESKLLIDNVEADRQYLVRIKPFFYEDNEEYIAQNNFTLISAGAVTSAQMTADVLWEGGIRVEWTDVFVRKNSDETKATEYVIQISNATFGFSNATEETLTSRQFDFQFPAIDETYQFTLDCKLGEVMVRCGCTSIKTELPSKFATKSDSSYEIYSYEAKSKSWQESQNTCVRGNGHLTNVKNTKENKEIVSLSSSKQPFWIGGSNCGKVSSTWTDGTKWSFIKDPLESFEGKRCCLQVVPDTGWKGAQCETKSPFVCKFRPPNVIEAVEELKIVSKSSDEVLLKWMPAMKKWRPSSYKIHKCIQDSCEEAMVLHTSNAALLINLSPETNYELRVEAMLPQLEASSISSLETTTERKPEVKYAFSASGSMNITWLTKVEQNKGDTKCKVKFYPTAKGQELSRVSEGPAENIELKELAIAVNYTFELTDGEETHIFMAIAEPSCKEGRIQRGSRCFWAGTEAKIMEEASAQCERVGGKIAFFESVEEQVELSALSHRLQQQLWVEGNPTAVSFVNMKDVRGTSVNCRKVSPLNQDLYAEDCTKELAPLCEGPPEAPLLPQPQKLQAAAVNLTINESLRLFHLIGCSTFVGVVTFSLIILIICSIQSYRDGLNQICMEFSFLLVHILLLISIESPQQVDCPSVGICIHFFFMCGFLFLSLEATCILKGMSTIIPLKYLLKQWHYLVIGWGIPIIIIAFSASLLTDEYPGGNSIQCWLLLDTTVFYISTVVCGCFSGFCLLQIMLAYCCRPSINYEVDEESYVRERTLSYMRWVVALLDILASISYGIGVVAVNQLDDSLIAIYIVCNILLAVAILVLRCLGDIEVRRRLRICCSHKDQIQPYSSDPVQEFISQKSPYKTKPKEDVDKVKLNKDQFPIISNGQFVFARAYVFQP